MFARFALMLFLFATAGLFVGVTDADGQPGFGFGGRGRGSANDPSFAADQEVIHFLLDHHDSIHRTLTERTDGVETLTESDDPHVAAKIREHVPAMALRVKERRPIRMRDPLFAEIFRHADKIEIAYENTDHGVRVVETSDDPYVVKLIKAHAAAVSQFAERGYAEAHENHAVPSRDEDEPNHTAAPAVPAGDGLRPNGKGEELSPPSSACRGGGCTCGGRCSGAAS